MLCYYNNEYINQNLLKLSPFSAAFQYGAGFFTTLKVVNNSIFYLKEHLQRLETSCLSIHQILPDLEYEKIIKQLLILNNITNARVKILIFDEDKTNFSCIISLQKLLITDEYIRLGLKRDNRGDDFRFKHKTLNYFPNIFNLKQAKLNTYNDYLYYDNKNQILETSIANIFFIKADQIITPTLNLPILPGIIRKILIDQNSFSIYKINEGLVLVDELKKFDSAFLTNSIKGIQPISSIENINYYVEPVNTLKRYVSKIIN